ncbi:ketopantoate reductase family protein [Mucilaginibacter rubeus]|uniref:ketopantoate reductase family protein n=1 Tax=Mucilaginibacter rubeus TaxID=2027860 RepID=UPI001666C0FB|nr:2-dehydropantoate 2-reductase [Mucilaginibacter rubeus]GGA98478.1 2-dehydropantoate 2-reductase [Mucilaginibacter rubeus]
MKTIYIAGAGVIGRTLAVILKHAGKNVLLIRGTVDGLPGTSERIRINLPDGSEVSENIDVKTFSQIKTIDGIVVITAKSFANSTLAAKLALKGVHYPVVLLQNGLNVEQPFIMLGFTQLYRCVLFVTGQFTSENVVRFKPVATCPVGAINSNEESLAAVVSEINSPAFSFKPELNIQAVIWKKVIVNCVFNSVCPLLSIDNGIFHRNNEALAIGKRIIKECIQVANTYGVSLPEEEVTETLLAISRSSDGQLISTLQDINEHRPTEIATLNLEIARIAKELGLEDMVKETRLLGELTAIKSSLSLNR